VQVAEDALQLPDARIVRDGVELLAMVRLQRLEADPLAGERYVKCQPSPSS
jgi:hypothetical protein